jgi:Ca2+-binding RTX toxin-like protein
MGGAGNDIMDGGSGRDTVIFGGTFASLKITNWGSGFQVLSALNGADDWLVGIERIAADDGTWQFNSSKNIWSKLNGTVGQSLVGSSEIVNGTTGDDTLTYFGTSIHSAVFGDAGNDTLKSYANYARLYGGAGDDILESNVLIGGSNTQFFDGGIGTDTISVSGKFSDLTITQTSIGFTLATGVNTFVTSGIEHIKAGASTYSFDATTSKWVQIDGPAPSATVLNGTNGNDVMTSGWR